MKKPQFLTAKSLLITLTLAMVFAISTALLHAQTGAETNDQFTGQTEAQSESQNSHGRWRELQAQRLEGSWLLTISPVVPPDVQPPPSFRGNVSFSRGGVAFGADPRRPSSRQFGSWVHQWGNQFAATLREDLYDQAGNFTGTIKVRKRIIVTGKDEYIGVSNAEERNAAGELISSRCATVKAKRIAVEPLAPQCQSITPPQ